MPDARFSVRMSASTFEGKVIGRLLAARFSCTVVVADRNITTLMVNYSQIITASSPLPLAVHVRVLLAVGVRSVTRARQPSQSFYPTSLCLMAS